MAFYTKRLPTNSMHDDIGIIFKVSTEEAVAKFNNKFFTIDMGRVRAGCGAEPVVMGTINQKTGERVRYETKPYRPVTAAVLAGLARGSHRSKTGDSYDSATKTYTVDYTYEAFGRAPVAVPADIKKEIPSLQIHTDATSPVTLNNSNNYVTALAETLTVLKHTGLKVSNMVIDGDKTIINVA